jgi:hypothetical protein
MLVGHNDLGYEPERSPIEVGDLPTAIQVLCNEVISWFTPEMVGDDPELSQYELSLLLVQVRALRPRSKLCLRGRVFWIQ